MAKRIEFADLPIGACFAYDASSTKATRRKVDTWATVVIPGGKKVFRVDDVETRVYTKACPVNFGRRRKRYHSKRNY